MQDMLVRAVIVTHYGLTAGLEKLAFSGPVR